MIKNYQNLKVWELGMEITIEIYKITKTFPREELYSLVSQMRRAAISIPSNIAEGFNRNSKREFHRFLLISSGSCAELETQIEIGSRLGYFDKNIKIDLLERLDYESRMLNKLSKSFSEDNNRGTRNE